MYFATVQRLGANRDVLLVRICDETEKDKKHPNFFGSVCIELQPDDHARGTAWGLTVRDRLPLVKVAEVIGAMERAVASDGLEGYRYCVIRDDAEVWGFKSLKEGNDGRETGGTGDPDSTGGGPVG